MRVYNDPLGGKPSSHGEQIVTAFFERKAIEEVAPEQYFTQLASVTMMPKHAGKKIERYVHIPLLDDRNINDQGIDATGKRIAAGNLYGSSRDIGTITKSMPVLQERGGRVNRVGFNRQKIVGTMQNFGYFTEYTQESLDFDTEDDLDQYATSQMVATASKITEDLLQIDLTNAAGTVIYGGTAQSSAEMNETSKFSWQDLSRLSTALDRTRTPKSTKVITGSMKTDTKTLPAARVMFVGPALTEQLRRTVDYFGDAGWIPVQKYGDATTLLRGEIGTIDQFRVVQNPEMMFWEGAGAAVADDKNIATTDGKADIHPMLVVGDDCFTTIGFHPTGTNTKFQIIHKRPGEGQASNADPYGKRGFMSIQWWYGFMVTRPERIALIKTVVDL